MCCGPPGSSVRGILQAIILLWVAMPSPRGSSRPRDWTWVSCTTGDSLLLNHGGSPIYMYAAAAAAAKSLQSCPTLCDPIDGSPPGAAVPGILQARTLEWVAISFSNAWKWKVKVKSLSCIQLLATPWTTAYQAPLSMGLSRQEYWSGLPLPSPYICISSVQFNRSVMSNSLRPHELQYARPLCPSPTPGVYPNPCPSCQWCHPPISSSVFPFSSCPQSFPASVSMTQFFTSGGQSIGVSALTSVLPMNTQDSFPLGWTGWISLQSKGLSGAFSNTTVQQHQFFCAQQLSL